MYFQLSNSRCSSLNTSYDVSMHLRSAAVLPANRKGPYCLLSSGKVQTLPHLSYTGGYRIPLNFLHYFHSPQRISSPLYRKICYNPVFDSYRKMKWAQSPWYRAERSFFSGWRCCTGSLFHYFFLISVQCFWQIVFPIQLKMKKLLKGIQYIRSCITGLIIDVLAIHNIHVLQCLQYLIWRKVSVVSV